MYHTLSGMFFLNFAIDIMFILMSVYVYYVLSVSVRAHPASAGVVHGIRADPKFFGGEG